MRSSRNTTQKNSPLSDMGNRSRTPKFTQYYTQAKKITMDMKNKVMGMLKERNMKINPPPKPEIHKSKPVRSSYSSARGSAYQSKSKLDNYQVSI